MLPYLARRACGEVAMSKLLFALALVACAFVQISIAEDSEAVETTDVSVEAATDCQPKPPKPKCKKPNEVYEICPARCPFRTCGIDDRVIKCAAPPEPGSPDCPKSKCRCKSGFYRDSKGNCVRWECCNTTCTGVNEVYDPCDNPCPARRCDFDPTIVRCKAPPQVGDEECLVGCRCKDGYLRDDNGVCVEKDQCPKKCNENEFYDPCPGCNPQTCSTINETYSCPAIPANQTDPNCKGACRCKKGYARDNNGDCVLIKYCSKCNKPNEVYNPCPGCAPQTCETRGKIYHCPLQKSCKGACQCQKGYFRNKIGECISSEDCDKCTGDHEYWSCGSACDNRCDSQYGQDNCNIINVKCNPMCYCEKDYARAPNGTCIRKKDCPLTCTKPNEIYDKCDAPCPARTCDFDPTVSLCKVAPKPGDDDCVVGCRCKDGFLRNDKGVCIPKDQCPKKCKENEVYDPCPDCSPQTCSTVGEKFHCPLIPANNTDPRCKGACRCQKGYARNNDGDCVPIEYCSKCKGADEVYDPCPGCSPQTCETRDRIYVCPLIPSDPIDKRCKPTCRCKRGFFRNKIGQCISAENCAKCPGDHEYWSCGSACDNRCDSKYGQDNCNIKNIVCNKKCYCEKGYARATNGTCIPKKDCQYECPKNERYDECPAKFCGPKKCSDAGFPSGNCKISNEDEPCPGKPGCVCDNGFLRNDKGVCIPSQDCPSCGGDKNATLGCGINCGRLCSNYKRTDIACILLCKINACDCRKDHVYDSNTKKCVLPKDCTPVCKKNEVYSTCINGGCDKKNCTDLNKPRICVDPIKCKVGCVCTSGYLRAKNGTCVPIKECDVPLPTCKPNEEFLTCGLDGCKNRYCSDLDFPPRCRDTFACTPACECKEGFLRVSTTNDTCVPQDQCPPTSCNGDPNARSGCGTHCGNRCSDQNKPNEGVVACPAICQLDSCDCKFGYVFDDNTQLCVKPENCTATCGVNEQFSKCANGICRRQECPKTDQEFLCAPIHPSACKPGCICSANFLRAKNGTCIPEDQCEETEPIKCPKNEILVKCPQGICRPKTCDQAGFPIACPKFKRCPGKPGCVCAEGYLRNSDGICIPQDQCPSCGGDANAKPGCGVHCGNKCSNYKETEPIMCTALCNINSCDCRDGFVFDDNTQQCTKPENCTVPCGVNEEYSTCSNGLCRVQKCSEKGKSRPCPPMVPGSCLPGCVCPVKYLRSKNGTCVPEDECDVPPDPICPEGEILVQCPETMCEPETCKEAGFPKACPILGPDGQCPGKPRCICASGSLRNSSGVCVPKKQCPSCGGDDNAFPGCGVNCGRLCSNYKSKNKPFCPLFCNLNGCDCKKDFVYDGNGHKCVLPEKCTPTCQPTEVFSNCSNALCRPQKCPDKGKPWPCPKVAEGFCKPGCVCPPKYLRADNGTCIPEDQCKTKSCPEGERLDTCPPPPCDGDYCPITRDDPQTCPYPNNNSSICAAPRCVCGFNSHRDRLTGKCIATSQCPPFACDGPNEYFNDCVPTCPGETCNDYLTNATCPRFRIGIVVPCKLGCRCNKGYYRNENNVCIPGPKCKTPTCKPTEELNECSNALCRAQKCSDKGKPVACPGVTECIPGCVCPEGTLRNENGECVPENQCTPKEPPTCKPTEELNECSNALCRAQKCSDKGKPVACPGVTECIPGCVCPEGTLRNENGECVPENQCEPNEQCPEGEIFNQCPPIQCDGEFCPQSRDDPQSCPWPAPNDDASNCGKPRCICGFNQLRDRVSGKCVPTSKCPPFPCDGPNECFNSCVPSCPGETCNDYLTNATCPRFRIGIVVPCKLGCRCNKGYYRNENNVCIPGPKCKKPKPCGSEETTVAPTTTDTCDAEAQQKALERGNTELTGKLLYQVVKSNPGKSVFMSAFSVLTPLGELALYSKGSTYDQLATVLNIKDKSDIRCGFPGLLDSVQATEGTVLDAAAKVYVYDQGKISKPFEEDSEKIFKAKAENINFRDSEAASKTINDWVSDVTRGKIKDIVNPDMFDDSTRLALVNAIYFKGLWKYEFNPNNTKPRDFYINDNKTVQIPIMTQKGKFNYAELSDPDVQVVEMPCKDENITVVVILPKQKNGLLDLVEKLQDPKVFENIFNSLSKQTVTIYYPKISEIETEIDLKKELKKLGVTDIFDQSKVQLSGMTDPDEELVVTDAVQKASCSMNEQGAEAAAANAVIISKRNLPLPPPIEFNFNADHPFVFCIKGYNSALLFCGVFQN